MSNQQFATIGPAGKFNVPQIHMGRLAVDYKQASVAEYVAVKAPFGGLFLGDRVILQGGGRVWIGAHTRAYHK